MCYKVEMPEDPASKKKRQRHFWGWVTGTRKLPKNEVSRDFKKLNKLRAEHSELFPQLYGATKTFLVKEGVKEFHLKVLAFNQTMRDNDEFVYEDNIFPTLPLHEGDITLTASESFAKHYFAGYKNFVKSGGLSNHNAYQMHYLDKLYKTFRRNKKKNKFAIEKVKIEIERRQAKEAKKREEELKAQKEELERQKKKTDAERIKKLYKEHLEQQKKERKEARKRKAEDVAKRKTLKKLKTSIEKDGWMKQLTEEEEQLLTQDREERLLKHREDNDKKILDDMTIGQLPGTLRDESLVEPHSVGKLGEFKCKFCSALLWKKETKTLCCNTGQVPPVNPDKIEDKRILELYRGNTDLSRRFLENISGFNLIFSFTSLTTSGKLDNHIEKRLQGRVYHHIGYLKPERLQTQLEGRKCFWNDTGHCFLDIYFYYDKVNQVKFRTAQITKKLSKRRQNEECVYKANEEIVSLFFNYFASHNKCISGILNELDSTKELIKQHLERTGKLPDVSINLKAAVDVRTKGHKGVYHLPTTSSCVGAIVNLDSTNRHLQIAIQSPKPDTKLPTKLVNHNNVFYDAFQYPMLIPHGNIGYTHTLRLTQMGGKKRIYDRLTPADYYASLYMERENIVAVCFNNM